MRRFLFVVLAGLLPALLPAPRAQSVTVTLTPPPAMRGSLGLRGDTPPLSWERSLPLAGPDADGAYSARIDFPAGTHVVEVKAVVEVAGEAPVWEPGRNRVLLPGRVAEDRRAFGAPQAALPEPTVSAADVRADLALLDEALRTLHPGRTLHADEAVLAAAARRLSDDVRRLADASGDALPLGDVYLAVARFLATIRDGHTQLNPYNQGATVRGSLFARADRVPFAFRLVGRRMVVTADATPDGALPPGTEVLTLDGRGVGDVLDALLPLVRADGANDAKRLDLLQVSGASPAAEFDVFAGLVFPSAGPLALRVRLPDGTVAERTVARTTTDARRARLVARRFAEAPALAAWTEPDGTARLTVTTFSSDDPPDGTARIAAAFEAFAAQGARRLIVDLRGNEGGMDEVAHALFAHLIGAPVAVPPAQTVTAYRRVPDALRPFVRSWTDAYLDLGDAVVPVPGGGFERPMPDPMIVEPSPAAFRGPVAVIVDAAASSATFALAREIQRTGAATLVGQPTGGSRRGTNGGWIAFLTLPRTGLVVDIPLLGSRPPEPDAPDTGVVPDVLVAPDVEALRAGRDPELEAARAALAAADDPLAPFRLLVGDWAGELTYLDYQDDASRVTLGLRTSVREDAGALVLSTVYTEPDGREVGGGDARLAPGTDPSRLTYGAEWRVVSRDAAPGRLAVVIEREGEDNDRPATLRLTLTATPDAWQVVKEVRYGGTDAFFERNRSVLRAAK